MHRLGKQWVATSMVAMVLLLGRAHASAPARPAPQAAGGATYVGTETCKGCHAEVVDKFEANRHWQASLKVEGQQAERCESCHGPGSAHVEGGGDKTKIFVFKGASTKAASSQCLACHGQSQAHAGFLRSKHGRTDVSCNSCHSIHSAPVSQALLKQTTPELCYSCHSDTKAEFARPFRHRVNEGLISCNDCHNPHGGKVLKETRRSSSADAVCMTCHNDKQGPFVFEHVPVRTEGCISCHTPHGSNTQRMLKRANVNVLCLECHTATIFNAENVVSPTPAGPVHNQQQGRYNSCTLCHAFIHGSNSSNVFFKP